MTLIFSPGSRDQRAQLDSIIQPNHRWPGDLSGGEGASLSYGATPTYPALSFWGRTVSAALTCSPYCVSNTEPCAQQ